VEAAPKTVGKTLNELDVDDARTTKLVWEENSLLLLHPLNTVSKIASVVLPILLEYQYHHLEPPYLPLLVLLKPMIVKKVVERFACEGESLVDKAVQNSAHLQTSPDPKP
jgi:hypothetical protein